MTKSLQYRILLLSLLLACTAGFSSVLPTKPSVSTKSCTLTTFASLNDESTDSHDMVTTRRRSLLQGGMAAAMSFAFANTALMMPQVAHAAEEKIPMITTDEFTIILRDSAKSIQRVEFSGPKGETVRVKLVDGTQFGLKDVVESPSDPRSPLKVQAACREAKVPFKNLEFEKILASTPKKTKMYTNQRVQEAAAKEKERLERLAKDEEERLAELYKMEEQEATAARLSK